MELEDFKSIWNKQINQEIKRRPPSEQLNEITMNVSNAVTKLNETNVYWWNLTKKVITFFFVVIGINMALFLLVPKQFEKFQGALPAYCVFIIFGLITLWLYYEQVKIFDISDSNNIRTSIEKAVRRFNRWYTLSTMLYVVLFPILFYAVVVICLQPFYIDLSLGMEVSISIGLSVITLVFNHLYYKKTYFKWLDDLQSSLAELTKEGNS